MGKKLNCILLVDDDEASTFLTSILLDEAAVAKHIKTKQTARSALNYIADSAQLTAPTNNLPYPDLVFLDINMPAMDGWEFMDKYCEMLPKLPKKTTIIMLTTSLNPDDRDRASGMREIAHFFVKPLTPENIEWIIARFFNPGTIRSN